MSAHIQSPLPRRLRPFVLTLAVGGAFTCAAHAEPLVKVEGGQPKPGVVTEWQEEGDKVTLSVKAGTDAQAVADSIKNNVPRVRTKVQAGKVVVTGRSKDDLLKALAEVDFGGGDLDALANAALVDEDEGSGSSLRAKKTADLEKLFKNKDKLVVGQVVGVSYGAFPETTVSIKVVANPSGDLGKKIARGATIKVVPVLKKKGAATDFSDENTQNNAAAWYLKNKDKVRLLIGKEVKGAFEATVIDRE